jgi:hypothetical protein
MPWYLSELGRSDEPSWYFEDGQDLPRSMSNPKSIPDPSTWPIRVRLRKPRKTLPDYTVGPLTGIIVVSKRFKDLVEAWDPVSHVFVPLEIRQPDGTLWEGEERFIFKMAGFIEGGIIVEKSDVAESVYQGEVTHYDRTSLAPRLIWNADAIKGRHIWADKFFPKGRTVSDEFYTELKKQKIGSFLAIESRIDG